MARGLTSRFKLIGIVGLSAICSSFHDISHSSTSGHLSSIERRLARAPKGCAWNTWRHKMVCGSGATTATASSPTAAHKAVEVKGLQIAESSPRAFDNAINKGGARGNWTIRAADGHCSVMGSITRNSCANLNSNSCPKTTCKEAFVDVSEFVARSAFIGAVFCRLTVSVRACNCFYPGLGACRVQRNTQVTTFGDSTVRQFSFAW